MSDDLTFSKLNKAYSISYDMMIGLLVGAPRANTSEDQLRQGALYSCSLEPEIAGCEQLEVKQGKYKPWIYKDIQDDQGLGFSLASDGKENIVVCAPRWHAYEPKGSMLIDLPLGICFAKKGHASEFEAFSPPYDWSKVSLLSYLTDGSCQFGLSVAHVKDQSSFIFGSPGCLNWQGDAWEIDLNQPVTNITSLHRVNQLSPSDVDLGYRTGSNINFTVANLYLGYSVASINYRGVAAIVSSMPRTISTRNLIVEDEYRNAVLGPIIYILQQDPYNQFKLKVLDKIKPTLTNNKKTEDIKFTFFGYSLATVDVNSDGLEDIVVGAPFYSSGKNDQGAIFVYMQNTFSLPGDINQQLEYEMVEEEDSAPRVGAEPNGRFGTCIAALGDIDNDGYQDIAVGAPFVPGGGAVYIYMGSKAGLEKKYQQIIRASSLSTPMALSGFGFSISQRLPGDSGLGYDVAVGAHTSDVVLVFRSKVVLNMTWSLTFASNMDLTKKDCKYKEDWYSCVSATVCILYHKINPSNINPQNLEFSVFLTADKAKQRLFFSSGLAQLNDTVTRVEEDSLKCQEYIILAKAKFDDVVRPFPIQGEINLVNTDSKVMLSPHSERLLEKELDIVLHCVSEDVMDCQSDIRLTYNVPRNYTLMAPEPIEISFQVENLGETAYNTQLLIETFGYLSFTSSTNPNSCQPNNMLKRIECDIGILFTTNSKVDFNLYVTPSTSFFSSLETHDTFFNITATVKTSSALSNPDEAVKAFQIPIKVVASLDLTKEPSVPGVVYYNSSSYFKAPSEATSQEELGYEIKHKYKIFNRNKFSIYETEFTLMWPLKIDGKYLLYPMEYPIITGSRPGHCVYTGDKINPYNLLGNSSTKGYEEYIDTKTLAKSGRSVPESILPGKTTEYVLFNCSFGRLEEKKELYIELRFRLVLRTIGELEVGRDLQNVSSRAELRILQVPLGADPPGASYVSSVFTEISYKGDTPNFAVKWWVYLVSSLGGLLLLVLIALIMWKFGFFKRNRVERPENVAQKENADDDDGNEDGPEEMVVTPHTPMMNMTECANDDFEFN
ncbi:LOW QUALITY PROTEIN: integrin alpha-8 [Procambarus clarkii]|uniref:LOW QUALITY PROTEIN: integrin alpha-8 n=1 Tax=Procambarus clarkii TaxID=6728 RepID=UPI0037428D86